jgi:hypothetical protein
MMIRLAFAVFSVAVAPWPVDTQSSVCGVDSSGWRCLR